MTVGNSSAMYAQIRDRLADAIEANQIPGGTRLTESIVADHFEVSRQTARNALNALRVQGHVQAPEGKRGYFVKPIEGASAAVPDDPEKPLAKIGHLQRGKKWMQRYDAIKSELLAVASTGEFRIVPSNLADHHDISRTVLNDIQFRLIADNIVRLDGQKWILNRFDEAAISEQFAVRSLLEPYALDEGFDRIDRGFVQECLDRLDVASTQTADLTSVQLEELEADLHDRTLSYCNNAFLMDLLRKCRVVHVFNSFYYPRYNPRHLFAGDHATVFKAILAGDREKAGQALTFHLKYSARDTQKRLGRFAVDNSTIGVSYVKPL